MKETPIISLCIPTNGIIEWVFNALDSIFRQDVDVKLYEVVVTDNGNNSEFEKLMHEYVASHQNLKYVKTACEPFINEIEAYKRATGCFVKYLNHRSIMRPNTLKKYIEYIDSVKHSRPIIYFSNGALKKPKEVFKYDSFDEFVENLSYLSTWSTGMAFWKDDFDKIDFTEDIDVLFPHTAILFYERGNRDYIIDNRVFLDEQEVGAIPKARYDLFYAFAVDYPSILLRLRQNGDITTKTFLSIKRDLLGFLVDLYFSFCIRRKPCSYDLSSFKESMGVLYSRNEVRGAIFKRVIGGARNYMHHLILGRAKSE